MAEQAYEFENFPRGKLPASLTRRQFFSGLMNEVRAFAHEEGHPVYRLDDLGDLPDGELAQVRPVLLPGCETFQEDGYVWGKTPEGRKGVRLFPVDSPAAFVLEQFDGEAMIIEAARRLASGLGWEKKRAFAYVRGVFLWLVLARLSVPGAEKKRNQKI